MDPLSAFSLACNVIAVIDFGIEVVSLCNTAHKQRHPLLGLAETGRQFETIVSSLQDRLQAGLAVGPRSKDDEELLSLAERCHHSADQLLEERSKYEIRDGPGRWRQAVGASIKALWASKTVKKLNEDLQSSRRALDTGILIHLRQVFME